MSPKSRVLFQYLHVKQVKQIRYKVLDILDVKAKYVASITLVCKKNKIVELNRSESKIVNKITEHIKAKGYNICCNNSLHHYHWMKNAKTKLLFG